jgi:hypothetical protein
VALTFGALRAPLVSAKGHELTGYRYFLDASHMRCYAHATSVVFTIAGGRRKVACHSGTFEASGAIVPGRSYKVTVVARNARGRAGKPRSVIIRLKSNAQWVARL